MRDNAFEADTKEQGSSKPRSQLPCPSCWAKYLATTMADAAMLQAAWSATAVHLSSAYKCSCFAAMNSAAAGRPLLRTSQLRGRTFLGTLACLPMCRRSLQPLVAVCLTSTGRGD